MKYASTKFYHHMRHQKNWIQHSFPWVDRDLCFELANRHSCLRLIKGVHLIGLPLLLSRLTKVQVPDHWWLASGFSFFSKGEVSCLFACCLLKDAQSADLKKPCDQSIPESPPKLFIIESNASFDYLWSPWWVHDLLIPVRVPDSSVLAPWRTCPFPVWVENWRLLTST